MLILRLLCFCLLASALVVVANASAATNDPPVKKADTPKTMQAKDASARSTTAAAGQSPPSGETSLEQLEETLKKGVSSGTVKLSTQGKHKVDQRQARSSRLSNLTAEASPKSAKLALNSTKTQARLQAKATQQTASLLSDVVPSGHGAHTGAGQNKVLPWSYEGEFGPQAWSKLMPEFSNCAHGTRQSPIHIQDETTVSGPAEPLQIRYQPSTGSVVNNGHSIQADVQGENVLFIRGTEYKLVQFHAHHPAEERINHKGFAMAMHLVHRSPEGKIAVIAVLLDPGTPNPLIEKIWTYMPLDAYDRVKLPKDSVNLNELLPQDRRYYQFMGSMTTPPCSEGVLWLVLKQPQSLGRDQLRLFSRIFPNNARPTQAIHGRLVRSAD